MGPKKLEFEPEHLNKNANWLQSQMSVLMKKIESANTPSSARSISRALKADVDSVLERTDALMEAITISKEHETLAPLQEKIMELRLDLSIKYQELCDSTEQTADSMASTSSPTVTANNEVNALQLFQLLLPGVPEFDGDILKFPAFKTAFDRSVNDLDIPSHLKMSALQKLIRGAAGSFLTHYGTTPEDYTNAYKHLVEQYTSPRRVADAVLMSFLSISPCTNATRLHELENFRNRIGASYHALQNLKIENLADFILFNSIKARLPHATQDKLHDEIGSNKIPDVSTALHFLDLELARLRSRSQTQPDQPKSRDEHRNPRPIKSHVSVYVNNCSICSESHNIYNCTKFRGLRILDRIGNW